MWRYAMSITSSKTWPHVQQQPLHCSAWCGNPIPSTHLSMEEGEEVPAGIPNNAHGPAPGRSVSNGILFIRGFS